MKRIVVVLVASSFAVLAACNVNIWGGDQQQGQGQDQGTGPTPVGSPSPSAECRLTSLDAGTDFDATSVVVGGDPVVIGVFLIGPQGFPLTPECRNQYVGVWSGGSPCVLASTGFDGTLRAPTGTPVGTTCTATVTVAGLTDVVVLDVVAAP